MHRPLATCMRFVQQWSSQEPAKEATWQLLDTTALGSAAALTFWRPQAPIGYAILGDCAVRGTSQPTFQARRCTHMTG